MIGSARRGVRRPMETVTLGVGRDGTSWGLWSQMTFEPEGGEEEEGPGGGTAGAGVPGLEPRVRRSG